MYLECLAALKGWPKRVSVKGRRGATAVFRAVLNLEEGSVVLKFGLACVRLMACGQYYGCADVSLASMSYRWLGQEACCKGL